MRFGRESTQGLGTRSGKRGGRIRRGACPGGNVDDENVAAARELLGQPGGIARHDPPPRRWVHDDIEQHRDVIKDIRQSSLQFGAHGTPRTLSYRLARPLVQLV